MNKTEIINGIADAADISKIAAGRALDAFVNLVSDSLQKQDDVTLIGFGTFTVRERAARNGRNPKTGEVIQIKASKQPVFKAGKALKDALQGKDK